MGKQFVLIFDAKLHGGEPITDTALMVREPPLGGRSVCTLVAARNGMDWIEIVLSKAERNQIVAALLSFDEPKLSVGGH